LDCVLPQVSQTELSGSDFQFLHDRGVFGVGGDQIAQALCRRGMTGHAAAAR
jgi:hypothetical protein